MNLSESEKSWLGFGGALALLLLLMLCLTTAAIAGRLKELVVHVEVAEPIDHPIECRTVIEGNLHADGGVTVESGGVLELQGSPPLREAPK
jgi:hypothetical protein